MNPPSDEAFMSEAIRLASLGRGRVEPNPMVGAVIVRDGQSVASGHHKRFGGPHAEIEAIRAAARAGELTAGTTIYVSLEPCCFTGKTPPCTDALIRAGFARVVVAMQDPDPNVAGGGIAALRAAGIRVDVGVREPAARQLLAPYAKLRTSRRPWATCKWAQTADGKLALPASLGRWISCDESRRVVHEMRARADGILVGISTVLADDPLLTNRLAAGRQPVRVVLDSSVRLPIDSRLALSPAVSQVIVAATGRGVEAAAERCDALRRMGIDILPLPADAAGRVSLPALLDELGRRRWTHLLVEGGPCVLGGFIYSHLADELAVFVSPDRIGPTGADQPCFDAAEVRRRLDLPAGESSPVGRDTLLRWTLAAAPPSRSATSPT
jgi:diaminohydroxyphosphoribosylaminopyrimidine deaminase/5-amino-6-(5-phosphoribosylamino)uracil reductase